MLDLGRPAEARLPGHVVELTPDEPYNREIVAGQSVPIRGADPVPGEVTQADLDHITQSYR